MHDISSSIRETFTPISVNAFCGKLVMTLLCLSKLSQSPPVIEPPLLKAQMLLAGIEPKRGLQPSPANDTFKT